MYLVLPLELCPHAPELGLGAGGWDDVVHDVNVNVVEDDNIAVAGSALHVVHNVSEDDPVLRRGNLHARLDVREVVWSQNDRLKKRIDVKIVKLIDCIITVKVLRC